MRRYEFLARYARILQSSGALLLAFALAVGLWIGIGGKKSESVGLAKVSGATANNGQQSNKLSSVEKPGIGVAVPGEASASGSHSQLVPFRSKPMEPTAMLAVLANGAQSAAERGQELQEMRGRSFSGEERRAALTFLSGNIVLEGMGRGSVDWLSDELLTALRLQEPPWDGLAAALGEVAFQPQTNPVTRGYIVQHLGHLWEQYGAREEIEKALWRATATADELAPGSALIALSRGYARDGADGKLEEVRARALGLARNPSGPLAVRVTALAIAGEDGGREVKKFAADLAADAATPVILRKVAENVLAK